MNEIENTGQCQPTTFVAAPSFQVLKSVTGGSPIQSAVRTLAQFTR